MVFGRRRYDSWDEWPREKKAISSHRSLGDINDRIEDLKEADGRYLVFGKRHKDRQRAVNALSNGTEQICRNLYMPEAEKIARSESMKQGLTLLFSALVIVCLSIFLGFLTGIPGLSYLTGVIGSLIGGSLGVKGMKLIDEATGISPVHKVK